MEINKLIEIVKDKITREIVLQEINIEDKSFLHRKHKNNSPNKFHIKITIISDELKSEKKIDSTKIIYKILENELKNYIHSIQLSIN
ncbi:BolA family transcriptional regulator [Candidatus Pelagibacter sp.]|nr:BolA family transcriptional regulator [Candidatus Pelagibacter sp.]